MLGGRAVAISSPCLVPSDNITCQFEEYESVEAFKSPDDGRPTMAVCVSPAFSKLGSKIVQITVIDSNGTMKYFMSTRFYAGMFLLRVLLSSLVNKYYEQSFKLDF